MFAKITALAFFSTLVAAQIHAPDGPLLGNAISAPARGEMVPTCQEYTVTWKADTPNTISILLLRGPSDNVQKLHELALGINNIGTFSWTPRVDLEPTGSGSGYGLQIIDDVTGQYQYSDQFGIKRGDTCPDGIGWTPTPTATPTAMVTMIRRDAV